jgi:large subunit ribosomal protein L3|tara:strand:+ start:4261 stop:4875 length:615 start_codon:yes stop_codon:yes gene_type:complete
MVLGLLGNKVGMTHIFDSNGDIIPVTILKVGPCFITQIKTDETDGYNALQLGYCEIARKYSTKPQYGHFAKIGLPPLRYTREYKVDNLTSFSLAQEISSDIFEVGQKVQVTAKSIGKGFAGLQKRHNFARGPMTHGSKNHRAPGSIGAGTTPGRVLVGKKMAGQMGNRFVSISNLEIVKINSDQNLVVVKGSIPGKPGNLVSIQ